MGFAVWTNNPEFARVADQAGVAPACIGRGEPGGPPTVAPKRVDVAAVTANRWWPLAERAIGRLAPATTVDRLPELPRDELLRRISAARVLVHPAAIEGHSGLGEEARARATVPVGLTSNRFGVGFREDEGGLAVERVEDVAPAVEALLEEPERLERIARAGRRKALADVAWEPFVGRVRHALDTLPDHPGRVALGAMGRALAVERRDLQVVRRGPA
jgi:glycosyltransferase involved in cell wall biosynthesis